jgi:flagellar hook-associated protein 3 FlgL
MKVTDNSTYRLMQTNLDRITNDLLNLRLQGATGLKLNKSSDDPGAIRPVLTTRSQLQQNERFLETMGQSADKMAATDGYLAQVENVLVRAKELAINAINSSLSSTDLGTLADEISEMRNALLDTANAMVDGKYIFAGYEEKTRPFTVNPGYIPADYNPADPTTWWAVYHGDDNPFQLEITPGEVVATNLTGRELFFGIANGSADLSPDGVTRVEMFSVLTRLEEAVRAGNVDDLLGAGGSIQAQMANLEIAADQNRGLRSSLGARAQRVDIAMGHQEDAKIDLRQILSRYEDADMIEVFNDIVQKESAFQAALNISARVSKISILDYF